MNIAFRFLDSLSVDPFKLDEFMRDPMPHAIDVGVVVSDLVPQGSWARCAMCGDPGQDPLPEPDVPPPPALG